MPPRHQCGHPRTVENTYARQCRECRNAKKRVPKAGIPKPRHRTTAAQRQMLAERGVFCPSRAEEALAQQAIVRYRTEKAMADERRIRRGQKSIQQMIAEIDARMTDEMLDRQARVRGYIDVSAIKAHPWYRNAPKVI